MPPRGCEFRFERASFELPLYLGEKGRQLRMTSNSILNVYDSAANLDMTIAINGQVSKGLLQFNDAAENHDAVPNWENKHKFLSFDEPCRIDRRCSSVPRTWKPATSRQGKSSLKSPCSLSSGCSTGSELSSMSDVESVDDFSSSVDVESASAYFACSTPTSSLGSPRGFMESEAHQCGTCLPHSCEGCGEVQSCAKPACARTRLTSAAPAS